MASVAPVFGGIESLADAALEAGERCIETKMIIKVCQDIKRLQGIYGVLPSVKAFIFSRTRKRHF